MTPAQERALLDAATAGLDDALREGFAELVALISGGMAPRDAVQQVMDSFAGQMTDTMQTAFGALVAQGVGTAADQAAVDWPAQRVRLSQRLYSQSQRVSADVESIVRRHTGGFQEARALALDLFEGYGFREANAEPLQISPRNQQLPRYMREALLTDDKVLAEARRIYAKMQAGGLRTESLRAAYSEALEALERLEEGVGQDLLQKRLRVAFFERVRYFAKRVAQTELHRAYSAQEAQRLLDDPDVEFVQVRRAPGTAGDCICSLITGRDLYGLGPGVYPKDRAPRPPNHPFCRCVLSPRLDLTGRKAGQEDPDGDAYFLKRLNQSMAGRIMGSRARAEAVLRGSRALDVVNAGKPAEYQIKPLAG